MPPKAPKTVRVAVTQHEAAWLDLEASVTKTCKIIEEAAAADAKLVAFPEVWIPGYPVWIWERPMDFDLGLRYVENSLSISSPEMSRIRAAAASNHISVSLGFSERAAGDSLYISQALISSTGDLLVHRRKMKPTHMERTIFGDATAECLAPVVEVEDVGRVAGLSCWEHIQPLLKYWTMSQNQQVHVAAWPPLFPFQEGSPGFFSMSADGAKNLSQAYAMESQSFVLHTTAVISSSGLETMKSSANPVFPGDNIGSSAVIGPDGRILKEGEAGNEQLIIADLDMSLVTKTRTFADAAGHYSRPDMLWLGADTTVKSIVRKQV